MIAEKRKLFCFLNESGFVADDTMQSIVLSSSHQHLTVRCDIMVHVCLHHLL